MQAAIQSLVALLQNALDASVERAPVIHRATGAGPDVTFEISDHGQGMPETVLRRIAEPFFTTKEPGKGMGLGTFLVRTFAERLGGSLSYRIHSWQRHHGHSQIATEIRRGTACMPLPEESPLALVVDDDEVFRNRLCRALSQRNWEASAVASGEEALAFAGERSPDLVLVDLKMPGMGGLDVVQELRAIDSSMTIIVLTGYGSIPTAISAMKKGADHYLSKPADADQILAAYESLRTAPDSTPDPTCNRPESGQSRVGAHAACDRGLRREHIASCAPAGHSSPFIAA